MTRLRKALNHNSRDPIYIETLQKKGYRWCQQIEPCNEVNSQTRISAIVTLSIIILIMAFWVLTENQDTESVPINSLTIEHQGEELEVIVGATEELSDEDIKQIGNIVEDITGLETKEIDVIVEKPAVECNEQEKDCKKSNNH